MAAPTFVFVQATRGWTAGAVTEISGTSGAGAPLGTLAAMVNFASHRGPQGARANNGFAAANPVPPGESSWEFVLGLALVTPATNGVSNLKVWFPAFAPPAGITFFAGALAASGYADPIAGPSPRAVRAWWTLADDATPGAYLAPAAPANVPGALSDPVYLQASAASDAAPGDVAGMPAIALSLDWS